MRRVMTQSEKESQVSVEVQDHSELPNRGYPSQEGELCARHDPTATSQTVHAPCSRIVEALPARFTDLNLIWRTRTILETLKTTNNLESQDDNTPSSF